MAEGADGFLGRWARRKEQVRQGKPLDEPVVPAQVPPGTDALKAGAEAGAALSPVPPASAHGEASSTPAEPAKVLTLDDVKDLNKDSDFKPFMQRAVEPGVRNAAMKKLFADPHFNVMDRLDIYIDDYSQPDPIPAAMLRQMTSAKFLKLFDDEEEEASAKAAPAGLAPGPAANAASAESAGTEATRESANTAVDTSVAQSQPALDEPGVSTDLPDPTRSQEATTSATRQDENAHTDLRLQPDDAAAARDSGRGAS
ncbi:MAG: DUF3306 domain-containing protein [Pseudomonadota bacterium]